MASIRVRLLLVAVVVAVAAVVATTIIAQRVATEDVRAAVERDLELELEVAVEIEDYANAFQTWDGLDAFVDLLAFELGERIAVTDDFGRTLADSDPSEALPAQPIARVDPEVIAIEGEAFEQAVLTCEVLAGAGEPVADDEIDDCVELVLEELGPGVVGGALVYLGDESTTDASLLGSDGPDARLYAVALVVVVLAVALAAAVGWPMLAPIRTLGRGATRLGEGDLGSRVPERGASELAGLARTFNTMADALERDDERRRQWTTDVAHELRSPLQNLRGQIESAQDGLMAVDDGWYDSVLDEVGQLSHLVEDLQTLTLADSERLVLDRRHVEVAELARDVARAHEARASAGGIDLVVDGAGAAELDERRIRQVLGNLLDNALRHTPAGGSVRITIESSATALTIRVEDTGQGIPAEVVSDVFDRFRRADAARGRSTGGSGLGLAIVRSLVEAHGGSIGLTSRVGVGTAVLITIPADGSGDPPAA